MASDPSVYGQRLDLGQQVVVRDAFNVLRKAVVMPIPADERDRSGSKVETSRGRFRKTWVSIEGRAAVPWPSADVFTDLDAAKEAVRVNA